VGAPDATHATGLAQEWGGNTQALTDLRAAIATAQRGTLVLIGDPGAFGTPARSVADRSGNATRLDVEELDSAEERGVKVATLEPIPAALTQFAEAGVKLAGGGAGVAGGPEMESAPVHGGRDWALLAPLSRFARPVRELLEILPTIGAPRALSIHSFGTPAHGSLGARLFDAADLAVLLMGPALPEAVHAVYTTPAPGARGVHTAPPAPDHIRGLDGDVSASLRFDGNRAATITASNRAGSHALALTLLTESATVSVRADRLTVHHHGEGVIPVAPAARPDEDPFVEALATQLTRYMDSGVGLAGQVDFAATLALCQAALLSARTGEPESPSTMRRLAGL